MLPALFAAPALRLAAPVVGVVLVLGGVAGGWQWVQRIRAEARAAEVAARVAGEELAAVRLALEVERENAQVAADLAAAEAARVAELQPRVEQLLQEVRRARTPVPPACAGVLDPLRDAVRGVRSLRSRSASGAGGPPAAGGAAPLR